MNWWDTFVEDLSTSDRERHAENMRTMTTEQKVDAMYASSQRPSGFAAPSAKNRFSSLSGATNTQRMSAAERSKALGYEMPAMKEAARVISESQNPIVRNAITRAGGRPAAGPTIGLDRQAQGVAAPVARPRPRLRRGR